MDERIISIETTFESADESTEAHASSKAVPGIQRSRFKARRRWHKNRLFVVFGGLCLLSIALMFLHIATVGSGYDRFEPSLLTITVTFAVFAVNFSFLEYQLSPYRALFRGIAWPHVLSSVCVLVLAIIPVAAALRGFWPGRVSAFFLPIVASSSIFLALVARRCADPAIRIREALSPKRLERFLVQLGTAACSELDQVDRLKLSSPKDMPMHEWDHRVPPRITFFDPFDSMLTLASAAAASGDGQIFDDAVDAILKMGAVSARKEPLILEGGIEADYKVRAIVLNHARDRVIQLVRMTLDIDRTDRYSRSLGDILGSYLRVEAAHSRQTEEFSRVVTSALSFLAVETFKKGWRASAMRALIVARECANKGLDNPPEVDPQMSFFELIRYPLLAQSLAECAMDKKDTDFLYRCMDMLGYLGCAAVKANQIDLGRQCAQSLVQIARKSRFLKLECFWSRCGMLPWQHAQERIEWMLSWVARLPEDRRNAWLESFSEAYSRISGNEVTIVLTWKEDEPHFSIQQSEKPRKMTYMDSYTVTYDYSDESMLRDLQLY